MEKENGLVYSAAEAKEMMKNSKEHGLEAIMEEALALVERSIIAMVGSNGEGGFPYIKAMMKAEAEGIKTIWFSTNTSSKRVSQFKKDSRACVYFLDQAAFKGLMLSGQMEILTDLESRKRLWVDGCEVYYPLGVEDPDYTVLRFTATSGNYYHGLKNTSFEL